MLTKGLMMNDCEPSATLRKVPAGAGEVTYWLSAGGTVHIDRQLHGVTVSLKIDDGSLLPISNEGRQRLMDILNGEW